MSTPPPPAGAALPSSSPLATLSSSRSPRTLGGNSLPPPQLATATPTALLLNPDADTQEPTRLAGVEGCAERRRDGAVSSIAASPTTATAAPSAVAGLLGLGQEEGGAMRGFGTAFLTRFANQAGQGGGGTLSMAAGNNGNNYNNLSQQQQQMQQEQQHRRQQHYTSSSAAVLASNNDGRYVSPTMLRNNDGANSKSPTATATLVVPNSLVVSSSDAADAAVTTNIKVSARLSTALRRTASASDIAMGHSSSSSSSAPPSAAALLSPLPSASSLSSSASAKQRQSIRQGGGGAPVTASSATAGTNGTSPRDAVVVADTPAAVGVVDVDVVDIIDDSFAPPDLYEEEDTMRMHRQAGDAEGGGGGHEEGSDEPTAIAMTTLANSSSLGSTVSLSIPSILLSPPANLTPTGYVDYALHSIPISQQAQQQQAVPRRTKLTLVGGSGGGGSSPSSPVVVVTAAMGNLQNQPNAGDDDDNAAVVVAEGNDNAAGQEQKEASPIPISGQQERAQAAPDLLAVAVPNNGSAVAPSHGAAVVMDADAVAAAQSSEEHTVFTASDHNAVSAMADGAMGGHHHDDGGVVSAPHAHGAPPNHPDTLPPPDGDVYVNDAAAARVEVVGTVDDYGDGGDYDPMHDYYDELLAEAMGHHQQQERAAKRTNHDDDDDDNAGGGNDNINNNSNTNYYDFTMMGAMGPTVTTATASTARAAGNNNATSGSNTTNVNTSQRVSNSHTTAARENANATNSNNSTYVNSSNITPLPLGGDGSPSNNNSVGEGLAALRSNSNSNSQHFSFNPLNNNNNNNNSNSTSRPPPPPPRNAAEEALMRMRSQLTEEQQDVVKAITEGENVCCLAVAGAGKTTTSVVAAANFIDCHPGQCVYILTYNKLLKEQTRERVRLMPPRYQAAIVVDSYHASAGRYFKVGGVDSALHEAMQSRSASKRELPNYGLIIIDEAQDLTQTFYQYIRHFLTLLGAQNQKYNDGLSQQSAATAAAIYRNRSSGAISYGDGAAGLSLAAAAKGHRTPPQLMILGDPFQRIFGQMNGATVEFMYNAEDYFVKPGLIKPKSLVNLKLSICFRISHEMAEWVCEHLNPNNLETQYSEWWKTNGNGERVRSWWGSGIRANPNRAREPNSVQFIKSSWLDQVAITAAIKAMMAEFPKEEMAILSKQVRNLKPSHPTSQVLSKIGEEDWFLDDDNRANEGGDGKEAVRHNKHLVSSIHKFKGCERDGIAVLTVDGFGEGQSEKDPLELFNLFYVACTRARKKIVIVQWGETPYATMRPPRADGAVADDRPPPTRPQHCEVTKLLDYASFDPILSVQGPHAVDNTLWLGMPRCTRMNTIIPGRTKSTVEDVSAVMGIAIELKFEQQYGNIVCNRFPEIESAMAATVGGGGSGGRSAAHTFGKTFVEEYDLFRRESQDPQKCLLWTWPQLVHAALLVHVLDSRAYHMHRQVIKFEEWVQPAKMDMIFDQLILMLYEMLWCKRLPVGATVGVLDTHAADQHRGGNGISPQSSPMKNGSGSYSYSQQVPTQQQLTQSLTQGAGGGATSTLVTLETAAYPTCPACSGITADTKLAMLLTQQTRHELLLQAPFHLGWTYQWFAEDLGPLIVGAADFIDIEFEDEEDAKGDYSDNDDDDDAHNKGVGAPPPSAAAAAAATTTSTQQQQRRQKQQQASSFTYANAMSLEGMKKRLAALTAAGEGGTVSSSSSPHYSNAAAATHSTTAAAPPRRRRKCATIIELKLTKTESDAHITQLALYGALFLLTEMGYGPSDSIEYDPDDEHPHHTILAKDRGKRGSFERLRLCLIYPQLGVARRVVLSMNPFEYVYRMARRKVNRPFDRADFDNDVLRAIKDKEEAALAGQGRLGADGVIAPPPPAGTAAGATTGAGGDGVDTTTTTAAAQHAPSPYYNRHPLPANLDPAEYIALIEEQRAAIKALQARNAALEGSNKQMAKDLDTAKRDVVRAEAELHSVLTSISGQGGGGSGGEFNHHHDSGGVMDDSNFYISPEVEGEAPPHAVAPSVSAAAAAAVTSSSPPRVVSTATVVGHRLRDHIAAGMPPPPQHRHGVHECIDVSSGDDDDDDEGGVSGKGTTISSNSNAQHPPDVKREEEDGEEKRRATKRDREE